MAVRKLMDFIFSPIEMYWLDHMLPGEDRIKREDEMVSKYHHRLIYRFNVNLLGMCEFYLYSFM